MASGPSTCPSCGVEVPWGTMTCPVCRAAIARAGPGREAAPRAPASPDGRAGGVPQPSVVSRAHDNPFSAELSRRLARLAQWGEAAEPLGIDLPRLPPWAEEAAARSRTPEPWAEVVRGVERLAQRRISTAFERWEERTSARIGRLEAYSVDSRLERGQVEDALHAAQVGDIAQALATFQQVDRVVALKERHLDQARGELERLLGFLRDLGALGIVDPAEPGETGADLEAELRAGRLAPLKQQLRVLRSRAAERAAEALPERIGQLGDRLAARGGGAAPPAEEVRELAVAARALVEGNVEEASRRLRALRDARGLAEPAPAG